MERQDWQQGNALAIISKSMTPGLGFHRRVIGWEREQNIDHTARLVVNLIEPPPATTSVYVKHNLLTGKVDLYHLGLAYGNQGADGLVILDFGISGQSGSAYGTYLFARGGFVSTSQISTLTQAFLDGWWEGFGHQGYRESPNAKITVAVGTNNCGNGGVSPDMNVACIPGGDGRPNNLPPEHGQAWAGMVDGLRAYITANRRGSRETIAAASDMELAWNSADTTRNWVMGYSNYFSPGGPSGVIPPIKLYDYGTCEGCTSTFTVVPFSVVITDTTNPAITTTVTFSWTSDDILAKAWAAPYNYPVPEIYAQTGVHAREWYGLSRYGADTIGLPIRFAGSLTQAESCGSLCSDLGNSPSQGWVQLFDAVCSDAKTCLLNLPWSTDIRYQP